MELLRHINDVMKDSVISKNRNLTENSAYNVCIMCIKSRKYLIKHILLTLSGVIFGGENDQ